MNTNHNIYYHSSQNMKEIEDNSVALVITSPPYPMIEMWDGIFENQIAKATSQNDYNTIYNSMHEFLNGIWEEVDKKVIGGGIVCINIGDATKTLNNTFRLFTNHARIINQFEKMGYLSLPCIIWRKQTNSPNKFMGSGMYPPGAYITLEHEYILIFRKGDKRQFKKESVKQNRRESAYFWEERNMWFSDVWDFKGVKQGIQLDTTRKRSGAYPFELPYRLINMFSVKGDIVLDPFLGTGTTTLAALASQRNSIGYELDTNMSSIIENNITSATDRINMYIENRLNAHIDFIKREIDGKGADKLYKCTAHNFYVKTRQERDIEISTIQNINQQNKGMYSVEYEEINTELQYGSF